MASRIVEGPVAASKAANRGETEETAFAGRLLLGMASVGLTRRTAGAATLFAKKIQVSRQTAARWLNGSTESLELQSGIRLARLFGCDPVWLAIGEGSFAPQEKLSPDESLLLEKFRSWTPGRRNEVLDAFGSVSP